MQRETLTRYHNTLVWKDEFNFTCRRKMEKRIKFSKHASERMNERRINRNTIIRAYKDALRYNLYELYEVKTNNENQVKEWSIRFEISHKQDANIIFLDLGNELLVKSCYCNLNTDSHNTLDISLYVH